MAVAAGGGSFLPSQPAPKLIFPPCAKHTALRRGEHIGKERGGVPPAVRQGHFPGPEPRVQFRTRAAPIKGFLEHKYNLMLAKTVQRDLQELGATVILTRSGAGDVNNLARMSMVNLYALEAVKEKYQALLNKEGEGERAAFYGEHIREIGLLQEVMRLVIERPEFCTVYYNAPYDYTYTRAIHPDLKRIFEYEDDPLVYENMLFLSLHSNATGDPVDEGMNGTITYYLDNNWYGSKAYYRDYACVRQNRFFAHVLAEKVSAAGDFTNLGEAVNDFFMVRETNIPAVLLEVAYHTNDLDRQKLMSEAYRDKISGGIADSVLEYFSYIGQQKTALGV